MMAKTRAEVHRSRTVMHEVTNRRLLGLKQVRKLGKDRRVPGTSQKVLHGQHLRTAVRIQPSLINGYSSRTVEAARADCISEALLPAQRQALDVATEAAFGWNVHPLPMCHGPELRRRPSLFEGRIGTFSPRQHRRYKRPPRSSLILPFQSPRYVLDKFLTGIEGATSTDGRASFDALSD